MKKTKSPELKQIDKDISKLRGKLNLQRHRYTSLEIEGFELDLETLIYQRNELVNKEIVSNSLQMPTNMPNPEENKGIVSDSLQMPTNMPNPEENKGIVSNPLQTPTNMPNPEENKEIVSDSLQTPIAKPISFEDDDIILSHLQKPVILAATETPKAENKDDFVQEIDSETAAKMEAIEAATKREDTPPPASPPFALKESENGEDIEVKLSPTESATIITNFLEAFCRDALPPLYEWSCWRKEEIEDYRDLSRRRRQHKNDKKKGLIDKDEEFCEDQYEIELCDKFDRIEEYKENAPLTSHQKNDMFVAFKQYIAKKKIDFSPESGLFLALSSVVLAKASPIAKEKLKDLVKAIENEAE